MDEEKIKKAVKMIIEAIGENPDREGLIETPDRIARMYSEIFCGISQNADEHLTKTFSAPDSEMVIEKDIKFYSMCEHHLVPFYGQVHIAYIPSSKVAGLSKLARTVEVFAKRPQLQERLTSQIADALEKNLVPKGVMVIIEAEHMCMTMRGIKKPGSKTVTYSSRGIFKTDKSLRDDVINLIK
ncbi:MAG: GTP cyclohydrolase I FolE [Bacillota bacterium]|nr:GTP cyclohydrolase I FolE [Bacillota bacterium]